MLAGLSVSNLWDEITYCCTVEVWELISIFPHHCAMNVFTHPWWGPMSKHTNPHAKFYRLERFYDTTLKCYGSMFWNATLRELEIWSRVMNKQQYCTTRLCLTGGGGGGGGCSVQYMISVRKSIWNSNFAKSHSCIKSVSVIQSSCNFA